MRSIRHLPTAFEYYSAKQMTLFHKTPFYVYQDISPIKKYKHGFPVQDQGVDLADEDFTHIAQVKYYTGITPISYGKLSTFLATPLLVGKKDIHLTLLRPTTSILREDIECIVKRGDMKDFKLCADELLWEMQYRG
jgi:hypothetical protein